MGPVDYTAIRSEHQAGVTRVTFNRPERRNAMTWRMIEEILDAVERCADDPAVWVLVFQGAGRAFSSGDDIGAGMGERTRGGDPGGINADRGVHHTLVKRLLEYEPPSVDKWIDLKQT